MRGTSKIEWELARDDCFKGMYQTISETQLKKLQEAYLSMLVDFEKECENYGLTFYMVAGTLIGSLRHKGYIPWDDDIDLVMFREEYERLTYLFAESKNFQLISPKNEKSNIFKYTKIQSKFLTYFDVLGEGFSKKKYLYLDMLPIDFAPENNLVRKIKGSLFRLVDLSYSSSRCYKKYTPHLHYLSKYSDELRENLLIRKIVGLPAILIGPRNLYKLMEKFLKSNKKTSKITIAYGVKGYLGEVLDYDVFYPARKYPFEGKEFYGPNRADEYLANRYGDYMTLPPKSEQGERHVRLRDDWEESVER